MSRRLEKYDPATLTANPFEAQLRIPVTRSTNYKEFRQQEGDGLLLPKQYFVERLGSVRLFYAPGNKQMIYNLSDIAQRLYLYILLNLDQGKSFLQLNIDHYCATNEVAPRTYTRARDELLRYEFIAASQYKSVFYINPAIFFPGNRLSIYPNNLSISER